MCILPLDEPFNCERERPTMEIIRQLIDFILHLDQHLVNFVQVYGMWTYLVLFLIIFSETGIIFLSFLPGDSLLFATGALTAKADSALNIHLMFLLLLTASILGNNFNFLIGRYIGPKVFHSKESWLLNPKHLQTTHAFYEKHGGKAIILARFMPIIRSFAPFVAGIGDMNHAKFFFYNAIGGFLWIGTLLYASFWFGNLPLVKDHFSSIILGILIVSIMPAALEFARYTCAKKSA